MAKKMECMKCGATVGRKFLVVLGKKTLETWTEAAARHLGECLCFDYTREIYAGKVN